MVAITGALIPWLPGGPPAPRAGDTSLAPPVGLCILALAVASLWLGGIGETDKGFVARRADLIVAAAVPLLVAVGGLGVRFGLEVRGSLLLTDLILAGAVVGVALPIGLWMISGASNLEWVRVSWRVETWLVVLTVAAFALIVLLLRIAPDPAFGWDESVYAVAARAWTTQSPLTGWGIHRPPALSVLGAVPALLGASETGFRLITLALTSLILPVVWLLGRRIAGPLAGLGAALVIATASELQFGAGFFLDDLPSAMLLTSAMLVAWSALEEGDVKARFIWVAPLAAAAFYTRYGSILPIGAIGATIVMLWPGQLAARWKRVAGAGAIFVALLLPHLIWSVLKTGSPIGILAIAEAGTPAGNGLPAYLSALPVTLVGPLAGLAVIAGLCGFAFALGRALRSRTWTKRTRGLVFLGLPAAI